jgi:membrane fusion protein (multidrug efflux system)
MFKKFLIALGGFAVVVFTLGAIKVAQIKQMSSVSHVPPPTAVTTLEARAVDWHTYLKAIGTLAPVQGATVSADADGTIARIVADSGTAVEAGDLLVEFDTTVEAAQLVAAEARAELARVNFERAKDLWTRTGHLQVRGRRAIAQLKQTDAEVAALQAQIAKKHVRAPVRRPRRHPPGQCRTVCRPRGRPCCRCRSSIRSSSISACRSASLPALTLGSKVASSVDAFETSPLRATITAINSEVDAATRNIAVQATLANPQECCAPACSPASRSS